MLLYSIYIVIIEDSMDENLPVLTADQFRAALPDKMKKNVSQELMDQINDTLNEPEFYEQYRDNLISYSHVIKEGKFRLDQYLNAVKYVSYKLMGYTHKDAYAKTFPDKMERFANDLVDPKDISSYVTAYNKSKLVNLIFEQTLIPVYVLNQDLYQKALNTQAELMVSAKSELVRTQAANSLLTQLKPPETKKVELNLGIGEDSSIAKLREITNEFTRMQRLQLESGMISVKEAAHSKIVDAEYEDVV